MRRAGARVNLLSLPLEEKGGEGTSGRPRPLSFLYYLYFALPLASMAIWTYRPDSTPHAP